MQHRAHCFQSLQLMQTCLCFLTVVHRQSYQQHTIAASTALHWGLQCRCTAPDNVVGLAVFWADFAPPIGLWKVYIVRPRSTTIMYIVHSPTGGANLPKIQQGWFESLCTLVPARQHTNAAINA